MRTSSSLFAHATFCVLHPQLKHLFQCSGFFTYACLMKTSSSLSVCIPHFQLFMHHERILFDFLHASVKQLLFSLVVCYIFNHSKTIETSCVVYTTLSIMQNESICFSFSLFVYTSFFVIMHA